LHDRMATRAELSAVGIAEEYHFKTLKDFKGEVPAVRNYINKFDELGPKGVGLFITGPSHTGKSMLAAIVAKAVLARNKPVRVTRIGNLTASMFDKDNPYSPFINIISTFFLVIDGIELVGTSSKEEYFVNDGMRAAFSEAVRWRFSSNYPTIITTTLPLETKNESVETLYGDDVSRIIKSRYGIVECEDNPEIVEEEERKLREELEG